jgi:hypothetical protein
MSKSDATTNAFNKLLGKTEQEKSVETKPIKNIEKKIEISETYINIRFPKEAKDLLTTFLNKEKGLPLSSGIREILFEYMKKNSLK